MNWKRLTSASPRRNTWPPAGESHARGQLLLGDLELGDARLDTAAFCSGVSSPCPARLVVGGLDCSGLEVSAPSAAVFLPVPYASSQWRSVHPAMPRSSAIPRTVAPVWTRTSRRPDDGTPRISSSWP
jgi:hypothetical protein